MNTHTVPTVRPCQFVVTFEVIERGDEHVKREVFYFITERAAKAFAATHGAYVQGDVVGSSVRRLAAV